MKIVILDYNYSIVRLKEIREWHKSNNILMHGSPVFKKESFYDEYGYRFRNDEDANAFLLRFGGFCIEDN